MASPRVVTADLELALRCARELRCGSVNIDEVPGFRTELTPFGASATLGSESRRACARRSAR